MKLKVVLLFALILSVLYAVYSISITRGIPPINEISKIPENTEETKSPAITNVSDWGIPDIPTEFKWKVSTIDEDSEETNTFGITWDKRYSNEDNPEWGSIVPGGILYEVSIPDSDPSYPHLKKYIREQLDLQLVELGWVYSIDYGNLYIAGMAADGVLGSYYGLIKMQDTNIRTIAHSYETQVSHWEGPETKEACPCTLHVKVFVSDVADLADYIPHVILDNSHKNTDTKEPSLTTPAQQKNLEIIKKLEANFENVQKNFSMEPTLGAYRWYGPNEVQFLSEDILLISFEDGHITGTAILEYSSESAAFKVLKTIPKFPITQNVWEELVKEYGELNYSPENYVKKYVQDGNVLNLLWTKATNNVFTN